MFKTIKKLFSSTNPPVRSDKTMLLISEGKERDIIDAVLDQKRNAIRNNGLIGESNGIKVINVSDIGRYQSHLKHKGSI